MDPRVLNRNITRVCKAKGARWLAVRMLHSNPVRFMQIVRAPLGSSSFGSHRIRIAEARRRLSR